MRYVKDSTDPVSQMVGTTIITGIFFMKKREHETSATKGATI